MSDSRNGPPASSDGQAQDDKLHDEAARLQATLKGALEKDEQTEQEKLQKLGRRKAGESTFRHQKMVDNETKIVIAIFVLMAIDIAVVCVLLARKTSDGTMVSTTYVAWLVSLAIGIPVGISAVLGAQTLHRHGWFIALFLSVGFVIGPVGMISANMPLLVLGVALCAFAVVGFYALGWLRGVPMWIGGRRAHVVDVSDGRLPGESSPGVLDEGPVAK